jgi:hypothetical protein
VWLDPGHTFLQGCFENSKSHQRAWKSHPTRVHLGGHVRRVVTAWCRQGFLWHHANNCSLQNFMQLCLPVAVYLPQSLSLHLPSLLIEL